MRPRLGGYLAAGWLLAIALSLFTVPEYLDVAVRDIGLAVGAYALARLAPVAEAAGRDRTLE